MLNEDNKKRYEELNRKLDNFYGWHHGASVINGVPIEKKVGFFDVVGGFIILQYEPKFDVRQSTISDKIYHLTLLQKLEKILNQGLTIRSSEQYFNFKDRIYFSNNIESLFFLAPQKVAQNEKEEDKEDNKNNNKFNEENKKKFVILEINTKMLNGEMRFFRDPNFNEGMYTMESIPKYAIKPVVKFELNDEDEIINKEYF